MRNFSHATSLKSLGVVAWLLSLTTVAAAAGNGDLARRYVEFCQTARQEALRPDACPSSPAAVVMRVGTDPAALAKFVKEHVAYEPLFGVVRGAGGTLAAQAGGDWDRANLLKAILNEAGYAARFSVLSRTDEQAAAVVDAWLKGPTPLGTLFAEKAAGEARHPGAKLLEQFGIPIKNVEMQQRRQKAQWTGMVDEAFDAAATQTPWIEKMLATEGQGRALDQWRAELIGAAQERVVVVLERGDQILDVSPDQPAWEKGNEKTELPSDRVASFSIQLLLNVSGQDSAHPIVLLTRTEPLGDLFRRPIRLEIVPGDQAASAKPTATWTPEDWHRFVSGFKTFQAILDVGEQSQASQAFDLEGNVHQVDSDGRIAGAKQLGGGVMGGFGGGMGGGGEAPEKPKAHIQSLILRMELSLPGKKPMVRERLIYGTLRPGVSPVCKIDALVSGGPVGAAPMAWMLTDAVTHNAPILAGLWTSDDPARFANLDRPMRMPVMLYRWQYGRMVLADRLLRAESSLTAVDGPSIVLRTTQLKVDEKSRRISRRDVVDVVVNGLKIVPRNGSAVASAVRANINAGVGATVLESVLLRSINPSAETKGAYAASQEAQADRAGGVLVAAASVSTKVKPTALAQWAMQRNAEGGVMLFARSEQAEVWWQIDPATGQTLGRGDGGEGQSAMEYLQVLKMNLSNLGCMLSFANGFITGQSNNKTAAAWVGCVTGADNPGNYIGAVGNVQDVFEVGGDLAKMGDILAGAYSISQM